MPEETMGPDGQYIRDVLMPEWLEQFQRKAADYNDNQNENHRVLGVRGQFADIWRKIGKLKKALWEGQPLVGEQPREILMDLIAHCFLTIAMLDEGKRALQLYDKLRATKDPVMVAGEPWQGPTKVRKPAEDPMVPSCGRVKCVRHAMVPLSRANLLAHPHD